VDVDRLPRAEEVGEYPDPSLGLRDEILVVHILDGVLAVLDLVVLAEDLEVVRRDAVLLEVLVALDGQDGGDVMLLELLQVQRRFEVAAHVDLRRDLGDVDLVEVDLVDDEDVPASVDHLPPVRVHLLWVLELEYPAWLPLRLQDLPFLDVVVVEVSLVPEDLEGVGPHLKFLGGMLTDKALIVFNLARYNIVESLLHSLLLLPLPCIDKHVPSSRMSPVT